MRPRVFAAEDGKCADAERVLPCRFNEAAGIRRGRRWPGLPEGASQALASMRPRVFAAEDVRCRDAVTLRTIGFNEAAGIRRGRRREQ